MEKEVYMQRVKVYISGPITGVEDYKKPFEEARAALEERGYIVLSPTMINPKFDMNYEDYMSIDMAMLTQCSAIYLLKGWNHSSGACRELDYAIQHDYLIITDNKELIDQ